MKRVLVTGGQGIIGRHTITELLARGVEVHALGRSAEKPTILPEGIYWHQFDILKDDANSLMQRVQPEAFLHLAWITDHGKFWSSPDNLDWVAASLKLVRAFGEAGGKRLVVSGSCAEYDWQNLGSGICTEKTPLGSQFLYGVAKDAFHRLAESYCLGEKISFAWGRIFLVYGEGESPTRFVPSVIRALKAGEVARVSHCQQVRDIMSTRDCGRAFAQLLCSQVTGSLNIASGEAVKLQTVVETIRKIIGYGEIEYGIVQANNSEPATLVADISRLKYEVGFSEENSLESGLALLYKWTR